MSNYFGHLLLSYNAEAAATEVQFTSLQSLQGGEVGEKARDRDGKWTGGKNLGKGKWGKKGS